MKIEKISIDGIIKDADEATLPATNQGLMSGLGVFETFRVCDGKVFLLDKHFARLQKSLKALRLNQINETKALENIIEIARLAKPGQDARVRFSVTVLGNAELTTIIYMSSIKKQEPQTVSVKILSGIVRNKPEYFDQTGFRIKSLDYLNVVLAHDQTIPDEVGVMLSPKGYVAEALTANIFWSKDGKIYTPPLSLGILPGVIRQFLIENFEITEKKATDAELIEADEIFLSSSVNFLKAVELINGNKKPGLDGPVFKRLYAGF